MSNLSKFTMDQPEPFFRKVSTPLRNLLINCAKEIIYIHSFCYYVNFGFKGKDFIYLFSLHSNLHNTLHFGNRIFFSFSNYFPIVFKGNGFWNFLLKTYYVCFVPSIHTNVLKHRFRWIFFMNRQPSLFP